MTPFNQLALLSRIARWRLTWDRRDTRYERLVPGNPKFMSPRRAAALIKDGSVVMTSGLGGNARASILYWAIRELFEETGHPRGLTVLATGGIGGRGKVPGTLEELGREGLCTRFGAGHLETYKAMLRLAEAGKLELQCLPQGIMAFLLEAQGRGEGSITTTTGVGTYFDPRVGTGSPVVDPSAPQWVTAAGDGLRYEMPKVNVALFNLPAADEDGNLYARGAAMVAECREAALAARRNGGVVIANVGRIVPRGWADVFLPAEAVDAIVEYPDTEQTAAVPHRKAWSMFTPESDVPAEEAIARLRFVNRVLGITPRRGPVEGAIARLAASVVAEQVGAVANVNVGVGLPEEVCRCLREAGLADRITFFTEAGVIGGLPAPGIYFGASVCPERVVSSAEIFRLAQQRLDATIVGMLEADSAGNVNVSRRGEGARNAVGPGGFIDFTCAARTVVFVGSWMARGKMAIEGERVRVAKAAAPKFVDRVAQVTFSGAEALKRGQRVFYCTSVGTFRLTPRGMELTAVFPGIDVKRDVLEASSMRIVVPPSGEVPVVDGRLVSGRPTLGLPGAVAG